MALVSAAEVIEFTGVDKDDLQLADDAALITAIDRWIVQVSDLIYANRRRDYEELFIENGTPIPDGIRNIALRAAANMVGYAIQRRQTSTVSVDDFNVRLVEDRIFTPSIKSDLASYGRSAGFQIFAISYVEPDDE